MEDLKTIDAETLLATPLKPLHFIVDSLVPPGLHLLGGNPKVGKSWLMLWLCLKVANGEQLWEFQSKKCGVLYLCLEDTFNRIQTRLFQITDEAPANLHFAIISEQIGNGLKEQIIRFIEQHHDIRLIVIDTLQRVRGANIDSNAYANDYRDLTELKGLADNHGIAIIIVHHLRKLGNDDPFQRVSGTTGLTGAVDTTFVLSKETSDTAKLFVTGRDVEYQEITLQFEDCIWKLINYEKSEDIKQKEIPHFLFRLVDFMSKKHKWQGSATELLAEIQDNSYPTNAITKLLNQYHSTFLLEKGVIYTYSRTGKARIITLMYDSYDGIDSDLPTEKEPSLLS